MSNFTTRSHERLGDPARRTALAKMTDRQSDARVRVTTDDIPDFDALRDRGAAIRDEAIQNLPRYLDQLVVSFERNGVVVHRAASAAEAIDIVSGIAARYGGPVVKGKSMLSEEIGLNERLEADGLEVFETDLGEFIIQLAGEPPEHILAPAIHWSRERGARSCSSRWPAARWETTPPSWWRSPAAICVHGSNRPRSASRASTSAWPRPARWWSSRTRETGASAPPCRRCTSR